MRTIELKWTCKDCGTTDILGRNKRCPKCGSPREKGEMKMEGLGKESYQGGRNVAATVTDPELLKLAQAKPDWFCSHCGSGNMGTGDRCSACGAPRYGTKEEDHPDFPTPEVGKQIDALNVDTVGVGRPNTFIPEDTSEEQINQRARPIRTKILLIGGGVFALVLLLAGFLFWAFQTHPVSGSVSEMTWNHTVLVQTWTPGTVRKWRHKTSESRAIPPVNGMGDRPGMELVSGSCRSEHYDDERYVCGSRRECTPRTRTESYTCGETCSDNGNGFATCRDKTCTRTVPDGESCQNVDEYCTRPIYKDRCDYLTHEWKTRLASPTSGKSTDKLTWAEPTPGTLERLRYTADYKVIVSYKDGSTSEMHTFNPTHSANFLGMGKEAIRDQAMAWDRQFLTWKVGQIVTVNVRNMGGVSEVLPAEGR